MIEQARESVRSHLAGMDLSARIEFVQSSAEDLGFLQDGSVDLIVAGVSSAQTVVLSCLLCLEFECLLI